jgi:hypothetical protein
LLLLQAIDYRFIVKGAPRCFRESLFQTRWWIMVVSVAGGEGDHNVSS